MWTGQAKCSARTALKHFPLLPQTPSSIYCLGLLEPQEPSTAFLRPLTLGDIVTLHSTWKPGPRNTKAPLKSPSSSLSSGAGFPAQPTSGTSYISLGSTEPFLSGDCAPASLVPALARPRFSQHLVWLFLTKSSTLLPCHCAWETHSSLGPCLLRSLLKDHLL